MPRARTPARLRRRRRKRPEPVIGCDFESGAIGAPLFVLARRLYLSPRSASSSHVSAAARSFEPRLSHFTHPADLFRLYHPSSTILPRDLPLSTSACARFRLAALMVPKIWWSVVRSTPLSIRSDTSFRR